ncbi:metallophosphoesterase family protein [Halotalea alkalilenta]|uniref:metallophosphoesterase family protein n=1 Tax=Halotalea alkalilenta TaxID=376489 RepID=UPI000694E061|nr:metallophosphoesterase [Halotalea alkalilenta]
MRLIQLGDIHLRADPAALVRGESPNRRFEAAIAAIGREHFDHLLLAGDVSDDGSVASYRRVIDACDALGRSWSWIPGNHDDPATMARLRPLDAPVMLGRWRLLPLDSWVAGSDGGELGAAQLARLAQSLDQASGPTLVALHHPPIEPPARWMGAIELSDRDAFWATLDAARRPPRGVLAGHIHMALEQRRGDVRVLTSPGCVDQFRRDADEFSVDRETLPGYLRLTLGDDQFDVEVVRFPFDAR